MTRIKAGSAVESSPIADLSEAEGYLVSICFKNGPPRLTGVELEFTVHDDAHPEAPIDLTRLRAALGPHAPTSLTAGSPQLPLSRGGTVSVEPGGQVEISTLPEPSLTRLVAATTADVDELTMLLAADGLTLGSSGIDPYRAPQLVLNTPRYRAMQRCFDCAGVDGVTMMCTTASVQVSIDAGARDRLAARWSAVHAIGPVLLAAFANSRRQAGRDSGWVSSRMRTWLGIDPARSAPVHGGNGPDPARDWARYVLFAPLLCRRRADDDWSVPQGFSFAAWIRSDALPPPTIDDLDYHASTLFPPVRPRGYLEVRYLDAQPPGEWLVPTAILSGLSLDDDLLEESRSICEPVRHRWRQAARFGLADPALGRAAEDLADVACRAVARTDLTAGQLADVSEAIERRFRRMESA
jgi:glutamate--cysteine ligase